MLLGRSSNVYLWTHMMVSGSPCLRFRFPNRTKLRTQWHWQERPVNLQSSNASIVWKFDDWLVGVFFSHWLRCDGWHGRFSRRTTEDFAWKMREAMLCFVYLTASFGYGHLGDHIACAAWAGLFVYWTHIFCPSIMPSSVFKKVAQRYSQECKQPQVFWIRTILPWAIVFVRMKKNKTRSNQT